MVGPLSLYADEAYVLAELFCNNHSHRKDVGINSGQPTAHRSLCENDDLFSNLTSCEKVRRKERNSSMPLGRPSFATIQNTAVIVFMLWG